MVGVDRLPIQQRIGRGDEQARLQPVEQDHQQVRVFTDLAGIRSAQVSGFFGEIGRQAGQHRRAFRAGKHRQALALAFQKVFGDLQRKRSLVIADRIGGEVHIPPLSIGNIGQMEL